MDPGRDHSALIRFCIPYCIRKGERALQLTLYDRDAAVRYAHTWAYARNPRYYDYEEIGGDCTNFASQCLFAGSGVMDYTPTFGWYYIDANRKSPSWTGVMYLYNYLTRVKRTVGPAARDTSIWEMQPGDIVQLSFDGVRYQHSPVVVAVNEPVTPDSILVAAHSYDADNRPLSTYDYRSIRYLHIIGVYRA